MNEEASRLYIASWKCSPRIEMPWHSGRWVQLTGRQRDRVGEQSVPGSYRSVRGSLVPAGAVVRSTKRWRARASAELLSYHLVVQVESIYPGFATSRHTCTCVVFCSFWAISFGQILSFSILLREWRLRVRQSWE